MESTLAVKLLDPAFHSTWSLWLQAPLFLCLTLLAAVTWLRRARRPLPEGAFLVLAVLFPLAIAVLLPQGEYHFSGHEGAYGELLAGGLPELGDLAGHRTFALPAGVAWALGQVLPEGRAIAVWLAVNRMALGLVLLLLADSCFLIHRRFCSEGDDSGN